MLLWSSEKAQQERQRAETLAAKLRELGVDPWCFDLNKTKLHIYVNLKILPSCIVKNKIWIIFKNKGWLIVKKLGIITSDEEMPSLSDDEI